MSEETDYAFDPETRFEPLEFMDIGGVADACEKPWWNQTMCGVNECVVRLGVLHGEFHWHHHDDEDEFFYVIEGRLLVDLEGRTEELGPRQAIMVPRGVRHRTRAPERTVVMMIEGAGVEPTGD